jgi:hypothetical protein
MSRCPKGLPICSADSHKESNITTDIKKDETFPEPKSEIRHRTRCVAPADWCQQRRPRVLHHYDFEAWERSVSAWR